MSAKNNCTFIGNLGRDAEQRFTQGGTAILSFSLPVSSGYGDNVKTSWVRCTIFGKKAESRLVDYLKKGQQVSVTGEISLNAYTNKEGIEKSSLELKVDDIALIGNKQENQQPYSRSQENGQQVSQYKQTADQARQSEYGSKHDDVPSGDNIPF